MNTNAIVEVNNLNVHYDDFQALHRVSLTIKQGTVVSIIGANGAGKSTLLNTIMGINQPTSGTIAFKGQQIGGMATNRIVAHGLSLSPEGSKVFEKMTVKENLLMGAYLPQARKQKDQSLAKVLELFPVLRDKAGQLATFLSGGQRQMLAIARSIMASPQILFCDEVSLGLAPVVIKEIYQKLQEINKAGLTVVLVEQDVRRSLKYSDYSYVMLKGKIVMAGKSSELPEDQVKDAYFGENQYAEIN